MLSRKKAKISKLLADCWGLGPWSISTVIGWTAYSSQASREQVRVAILDTSLTVGHFGASPMSPTVGHLFPLRAFFDAVLMSPTVGRGVPDRKTGFCFLSSFNRAFSASLQTRFSGRNISPDHLSKSLVGGCP